MIITKDKEGLLVRAPTLMEKSMGVAGGDTNNGRGRIKKSYLKCRR
jgi:hypothetical protein